MRSSTWMTQAIVRLSAVAYNEVRPDTLGCGKPVRATELSFRK